MPSQMNVEVAVLVVDHGPRWNCVPVAGQHHELDKFSLGNRALLAVGDWHQPN
jgi:hypothetical protein